MAGVECNEPPDFSHWGLTDPSCACVPVGGLWQARAARGPPEVDHLVLELDASYMDSSIDSQDQAEPPELTYIDPFVESF